MISTVRRLLRLQPGDGRPVGFTVAIAFCTSAGLMMGQSGIEALFFARHGVDALPVMYLLLAGTMFVLTLGFGALLARTGPRRAAVAVPLAVGVLALAGRAGLATGAAWVTQALWLLQGASYFVLGLSLWGVAGLVADTRQAKRFFPLIGAGSVVGYFVGGLATKPLASTIGAPNLLLVWVGTLVAAAILTVALLGSARERRPTHRHGGSEGFAAGLRFVAGSRLLRWLALAAVVFSLLFFSLYLPFSRAATERYPDAADLAGFFGVFFGVSTGVSLLVSLVVTNRLLARFGVPTVALVLPVLYAVAFGALAVGSSFAILAAARFVQVAWMQGGASTAWEAVLNTVPTDRRDQTRAFLYGGPTQVGTLLAGVVALVGAEAFSPSVLYGIGFAAAIVAIVAMIGVRRAYPRELVRALREGRPSVFGASAPNAGAALTSMVGDAAAVRAATEALVDPDPRVRRVAAAVLGELDAPSGAEALRSALRDADGGVRAEAVAALAIGGVAIDAVAALASDPEPRVRAAVARAAGLDPAPGGTVAAALLDDPEPAVRAHAAASTIRAGADPREAVAVLASLAEAPEEDARVAAFRVQHDVGRQETLVPIAARGTADPSPRVRAEAARALASVGGAAALAVLVGMTRDPSRAVREAVAEALGTVGSDAVAPVVAALDDPGCRDGALRALGRLDVDAEPARGAIRRSAEACVREAVDRHRAGRAIGTVGDGDRRYALLRDSLLHRADVEARTAIRAAALLGRRQELTVALDSLSARDGSQRANAIEVIDSVAERSLVRPLLAMWDGGPPPGEPRAVLDRARHDPDDWIRACADLAASPRGGSMETLTTLSPMERVLFLRKVPLFAELPPPDLLPIAEIATEAVYTDGETIAEQGDPGDEMHIIVSGAVAVVRRGESGGRALATRGTGDAVGEMAVLTSEPRMASLVARGDVRVLTIERRSFEAILRERPDTSLAVIRVLCQRLAEGPPGTEPTESDTAST